MDYAVPTIFAPPARPIRLGLYGRLIALLLAVACGTVIYYALILAPSHSGVGTHRGLGLYACSMLVNYDLPCPTCGMTTSFSWFFRGNLLASAYVQPAGFLLAYTTLLTFLAASYEALTARPVHRMLRIIPIRPLLISCLVLFILGWGWKIGIHRLGIDGW